MKGNVGALFTIMVFLGILSYLSIQTAITGARLTGLTNQTADNTSIITIGESDISSVQLCQFSSDIPIFGGLIWGATCIADFVGYTFSYAGIQTGYVWLGIIFVACSAALIYIGIRLLRGGG